MNIARIRYFIAAAEAESFTSAAASCYVSIQTISKAITYLERELGSPLFVRTKSGASLTEFGRAFYEKARQAEALFSELEHAGDGLGEASLPQDLTIAASYVLYRGSVVEDEDLQRFARQHPAINLIVLSGPSTECIRAAESHEVDAALVAGHFDSPVLEAREIACIRYAALMDERHPLAQLESVGVGDLRGVPLAAPTGLIHSYLHLMQVCEKQGFVPRLAGVVPTLEAHRDFVHRLQGVVPVIDGAWVKKSYPGCVVRPFRCDPSTTVPLRLFTDPAHERTAIESFRRFVENAVHRR